MLKGIEMKLIERCNTLAAAQIQDGSQFIGETLRDAAVRLKGIGLARHKAEQRASLSARGRACRRRALFIEAEVDRSRGGVGDHAPRRPVVRRERRDRCSARGDGGDYGLDGLIDELRIYARALSSDELAHPETLPEPGWLKAGAWSADAFKADWTTRDIDLSSGVHKPGHYEVQFLPASTAATLEIQNVELLIADRVIPDRVRRLAGQQDFSLYRMEQTTSDSPTAVRVTARMTGEKPGLGEVLVRPR